MSGDPLGRKNFLEKKIGKDLRLRLISAVILGPITLAVVWFGGYVFLIMVCAGTALIFREWADITTQSTVMRDGWLLICVMVLSIIFAAVSDGYYALIAIVPVLISAAVLPQFAGARKWVILGAVYIVFSAIGMIALRQGSYGLHAIFGLLILVWATDIGAYFSGRLFGGPKLWPAVSPGKTWSGACGGLLAAILLSTIAARVSGYHKLTEIALLVAFLSGISQLGDLAESALKRRFKVKDSGDLIPGHGGLLDRVDGLMLAVAAVFALAATVYGLSDPTRILADLQGAQ